MNLFVHVLGRKFLPVTLRLSSMLRQNHSSNDNSGNASSNRKTTIMKQIKKITNIVDDVEKKIRLSDKITDINLIETNFIRFKCLYDCRAVAIDEEKAKADRRSLADLDDVQEMINSTEADILILRFLLEIPVVELDPESKFAAMKNCF